MRRWRLLIALVLAVAGASVSATAASATTTRVDALTGTEVVPVSSVRGTFVGVATGELPAVWHAQIVHRPLATGTTVSVTGGSFSILSLTGRRLTGTVTGGSVTVTDRGSRCTNQTYHVVATLSIGSFDGTLTHHRRSILGRCVVYSASIVGRGVFAA